MKTMENKLAACNSEQNLIKSMAEFWFCEASDIILNKDGTVARKSGKLMSVKWWRSGKRFLFGY